MRPPGSASRDGPPKDNAMRNSYFSPAAKFNQATIMFDAMDLAVNAGKRRTPRSGGTRSLDHSGRRNPAAGGWRFSFAALGMRLTTPVRWATVCAVALAGVAIAGWIT